MWLPRAGAFARMDSWAEGPPVSERAQPTTRNAASTDSAFPSAQAEGVTAFDHLGTCQDLGQNPSKDPCMSDTFKRSFWGARKIPLLLLWSLCLRLSLSLPCQLLSAGDTELGKGGCHRAGPLPMREFNSNSVHVGGTSGLSSDFRREGHPLERAYLIDSAPYWGMEKYLFMY